MPKEEWGVKRLCPTTGKRFYDLNNDPIISPYTGEVVEVATGKTRMIAADAEDRQTKTTSDSSEKSEALEEDDVEAELADDVLEDDDDDNVSLDEIADVANEDND
jgi:uncharacterized protein (TIGR02300 family)